MYSALNVGSRAEHFLFEGKVSAAIEEYEKAFYADPRNLNIANALGDLYLKTGRTEDAIASFYDIAEAYRKEGYHVKSIAVFKKLAKLDPANTDVALKLADLLAKRGHIAE